MPVTRRPKDQDGQLPVDVDALILRGGSVAAERPQTERPKSKETSPVVLRVPAALLERISRVLDTRPVKIPRHTWLLEAVVEKLEREGG